MSAQPRRDGPARDWALYQFLALLLDG